MILRVNKFKVKKPSLGSFKNNKLSLVLGGTVATIFLLILLKAWLNRSDEADRVETSSAPTRPIPKREADEANQLKPLPPLSPEQKLRKLKAMNAEAHGLRRDQMAYKIQQQRLLKDFQKLAQLKVTLPGHLHYTSVDPEEGIAGVTGTSINGDETFSMLAAHGNITKEKIEAFLTDPNPSLPMLKGHTPQMDKVITEEAPASTGLGTLTIIPTTDSGGKSLFAVVAPRKDGKGTYMFIREGDKNTFESNEGFYDKMLEEMQAQP